MTRGAGGRWAARSVVLPWVWKGKKGEVSGSWGEPRAGRSLGGRVACVRRETHEGDRPEQLSRCLEGANTSPSLLPLPYA